MTLFGDHVEGDLARAVSLVEQTITALGIDPTASRVQTSDGSHRFALRRGSAAILVTVHPPAEKGQHGTLRVVAPVVRIPDSSKQHALYEHLLSLNVTQLVGAAFGISGDDVVLVAERSLVDLDASEVNDMVRVVGRAADRFDDVLAGEFETTRSSDSGSS